MRDNFIRHRSRYDLEHVIGLYCCALRLRDWFGRNFIHRENDGDPQVSKEFIRQIMDGSKWALLESFWIEFPDLVQGLDPDVMLRQELLTRPICTGTP